MVRTGIKTDAANIHNNEIGSFYRLWKRYCYTNPAAIAIGVELRSQFETERADREEIDAKLSPAKTKFCSGRHTSREINTRCSHNS